MISAWGVDHGEEVAKRVREVGGLIYHTTVKPGLSLEHSERKIPALRSVTRVWDKKTGELAGEHSAERSLKKPFTTQVNGAHTVPSYQRKGQATEALRQQRSALGTRKVRHSQTLSEDGQQFAAARPKLPKRTQKQRRVSLIQRSQAKARSKQRVREYEDNDNQIQAAAQAKMKRLGITPDMSPQERVRRIMEAGRNR